MAKEPLNEPTQLSSFRYIDQNGETQTVECQAVFLGDSFQEKKPLSEEAMKIRVNRNLVGLPMESCGRPPRLPKSEIDVSKWELVSKTIKSALESLDENTLFTKTLRDKIQEEIETSEKNIIVFRKMKEHGITAEDIFPGLNKTKK